MGGNPYMNWKFIILVLDVFYSTFLTKNHTFLQFFNSNLFSLLTDVGQLTKVMEMKGKGGWYSSLKPWEALNSESI